MCLDAVEPIGTFAVAERFFRQVPAADARIRLPTECFCQFQAEQSLCILKGLLFANAVRISSPPLLHPLKCGSGFEAFFHPVLRFLPRTLPVPWPAVPRFAG